MMVVMTEMIRFDARAFGIEACLSGLPQTAPTPIEGDRAYKLAWMKEWLRGYRTASRSQTGER